MSDATWLQELRVEFDPVGSWLLVVLTTVLLAAALLAFPPDRTRVGP